MNLQVSPVKHSDKERLMWERELMGLYISAHPLDSFAVYLSEQTQPLTQLKPDFDGREMTERLESLAEGCKFGNDSDCKLLKARIAEF